MKKYYLSKYDSNNNINKQKLLNLNLKIINENNEKVDTIRFEYNEQ